MRVRAIVNIKAVKGRPELYEAFGGLFGGNIICGFLPWEQVIAAGKAEVEAIENLKLEHYYMAKVRLDYLSGKQGHEKMITTAEVENRVESTMTFAQQRGTLYDIRPIIWELKKAFKLVEEKKGTDCVYATVVFLIYGDLPYYAGEGPEQLKAWVENGFTINTCIARLHRQAEAEIQAYEWPDPREPEKLREMYKKAKLVRRGDTYDFVCDAGEIATFVPWDEFLLIGKELVARIKKLEPIEYYRWLVRIDYVEEHTSRRYETVMIPVGAVNTLANALFEDWKAGEKIVTPASIQSAIAQKWKGERENVKIIAFAHCFRGIVPYFEGESAKSIEKFARNNFTIGDIVERLWGPRGPPKSVRKKMELIKRATPFRPDRAESCGSTLKRSFEGK